MHPPKNNDNLPLWAQMMYSENPNYNEVIEEYKKYHSINPFVKTRHTQYFKRWISANKNRVQADGSIFFPRPDQRQNHSARIAAQPSNNRGDLLWQYAGPKHHTAADGSMTSSEDHSNVYCHDRSLLNPGKLYCGTESGGAYITTNSGDEWSSITHELDITWVSAIKCKPTNDNFVLMSADNDLWRSTDSGLTWEVIGQASFVNQNISAWEILFNPEDNNMIYAATNQGLFRSTNNGDNWTEVLPNNCETVITKPNDPSVVYAIHYDNALGYALFYKSEDYGATFQSFSNGWFDTSMGDIQIDGGRLAVTEAAPDKIYALLVGYQNPGSSVTTNGWVGVWVSEDAGESWTLPHQLIGTPYTDSHPNLMNFNADDGDYSQIHYNTCIAASQLDPNKVLIGGLNLWISNDGCTSYEGVAGYIGGLNYFHVDQQEIHIYKTSASTEEIWISNDGGIAHSTDFMQSHLNKNRGLRAVNLWGYDQGWNEDMMVAGRYHNGNMAYHENYPSGEFLSLGGGEAATGYVNYNHENETFFSDIQGRVLPESLDENPEFIGLSLSPNESYWNNESSRILFDNDYYNVAWLGNENNLYRSTDGGSSYSQVFSFGNNPLNDVLWIEQSFVNHDVFYVHQGTGNSCKLWRSTDHGVSFSEVNLPLNLRYMNFALSSSNENELWVAYYDGANGQKIYSTQNGGQSWSNLTTSQLNGYSPWAICHPFGTNGGVYLAMLNGSVFYRNNDMSDWVAYSTGLPASAEPLRMVPFYKNNTLRLATWNLGVWEAPLYENSNIIANFSSALETFFCSGEPVQFTDHSVCSQAATYQWEFPGATPSSSTEKNPVVVYDQEGTYDVTLTITEGNQTSTKTRTEYISSLDASLGSIQEDFETGALPQNWSSQGAGAWSLTSDASAFGSGEHCVRFDNFYFDAQGATSDLRTTKINATSSMIINFSVAYARYGEGYSDTLSVLYSADCGSTWNQIFEEGGVTLATAPDTQGFFVPQSNQWEEKVISFSNEESGNPILFAFRNKGHYGNAIYLDNIMISTISSIDEKENSANLNVYPSPARDYLQVSLNGANHEYITMQLLDLSGKKVLEEKIFVAGSRLEKRVQLPELASGLYITQITAGDFTKSVKIFIQQK